MKVLGSIIHKEALHIVRDTRTLLVIVIIPVALLLLFGFAISMEVNNVRVVTVTDRITPMSREVVARLTANPYCDYLGETDAASAADRLRRGEADAALFLRTGHGSVRTQTVVDAANPTIGQTAAAYVGAVAAGTAGGTNVRTLYNPQLKSSYNFVPGIMGMIFILICAMMTSVSIVREKESGSMDLMLVSPARPFTIVAGKLVPYFVLSCFILFLSLLMAYTLLGLPFGASAVSVVVTSLLYIVLALSVGLLVSAIVSTQLTAMIVSAVLFMLPVIMLSGMLFPIENMPKVLQWLSCIIPARWYIEAMRKQMIQELTLGQVWSELAILCAMTLVIFVLAIRKFKSDT